MIFEEITEAGGVNLAVVEKAAVTAEAGQGSFLKHGCPMILA
jgi:hypothetical protein